MLTKKKVLLIGLLGTTIFFSPYLYNQTFGCYGSSSFFCSSLYEIVAIITILFPFLMLFSIITYKMKNEIFDAWRNFSTWFIPLSAFIILIAPEDHTSFIAPSTKTMAMGTFLFLYFFISLAIIARKSYQLRGKK